MLTSRQLRERTFLLRAPLIGVPVLTALFWLMGGGSGDAAGGKVAVQGFNTRLPAARLGKWSELEKLDYYQQAEKDSLAARQRRNMEASYARMLGLAAPDSGRGGIRPVDSNLRAVQEKLAEVRRVLAVPPVPSRPRANAAMPSVKPSAGMDRLERIMGQLRQKEANVSADPEMVQLNGLLDKLAAVSGMKGGPVKDSVRGVGMRETARRSVVAVRGLADADDTLSGVDTSAIEAMVSETQVLVSGGQLRLELRRDILAGGQRIPRGTVVVGTVALSGERLRVAVTAIVYEGRVYPVNLTLADEDGLAGIYIPGAPMSDAARETAVEEAGSLGPAFLSTSLAGEAAGAGVTLARSMLSRKMRQVKVTVPAGYRVILIQQNQGL